MLLAEVKRPGLDTFLNNEFRQIELQGGKNTPQVVAMEKASANSPNRVFNRRNRNAKSQRQEGPMLVGIRDNLLAVAWNQQDLDNLAARQAEAGSCSAGRSAGPGERGLRSGRGLAFMREHGTNRAQYRR